MNKNQKVSNEEQRAKEYNNKLADEISLNKVLDALGAEASTYKLAGMTHISSLLVEAN